MPQVRSETLQAFMGLSEEGRRTALTRMSPESKQKLLAEIQSAKQSPPAPDFSNVQSGASTTQNQPSLGQALRKVSRIDEALGLITGAPKAIGEFLQTKSQWEQDISRQLSDIVSGRQNVFSGTNVPGSVSQVHPGLMTSTGRDIFAATSPEQEMGKAAGNVAIGAALAAGTGGASLPLQVGVGGMTGALMSPEHPYIGGGLGMGIPVAASGAQGLANQLTKNETAARLYNAIARVPAGRRGTDFSTATGEFRTLPGRAMVNPEGSPYGEFARALTTSPTGAAPAAAAELKASSKALAEHLARSKTTIDIHSLIPLDDAAAFAKFNSALEATGLAGKNLSKLTPTEVNTLRSELGGRINWSPTAMTTDANDALMDTYGALNSKIAETVAGAKPMLKRLQEALLYNKALEHEIERRASRPMIIKFGEALKKAAIPTALGLTGYEILRD